MNIEKKFDVFTKIMNKTFPFIKELKIEDDGYNHTLFIKCKIDALEMCELYGIEPRDKGINRYGSTTLGIFTNDMDKKDELYNISQKINAYLAHYNKVLPEEFRFDKVPNCISFYGLNSNEF